MPESTRRLHLVTSTKSPALSRTDFFEPGTQHWLFPVPKKGLLVFVYFPAVTENDFRGVLHDSRPSFVLDLRAVPRFDIGRLNRRTAFAEFERFQSTYLDLAASTMGKENLEEVVDNLRTFLRTNKPPFDRPVLFLMDRVDERDGFANTVLDTMVRYGGTEAEVFELPRSEARQG